MALVGLISDTHGRLSVQAYSALAACDLIIHAGDICDPRILGELETLAPVSAVLGNNDFDEYGPDVGKFARPVVEGVRFLVAHYPHNVLISTFGSAGVAPGDPLPDICVHGHTHVPRLLFGKEAGAAQFLVCPGSCTLPRGGFPPSVGYVRCEGGRIAGVSINGLDGSVIDAKGDVGAV